MRLNTTCVAEYVNGVLSMINPKMTATVAAEIQHTVLYCCEQNYRVFTGCKLPVNN